MLHLLPTDATVVNADRTTDRYVGLRDGRIVVRHDRATPREALPAQRRPTDAAGRVGSPGEVEGRAHVDQVPGSGDPQEIRTVAEDALAGWPSVVVSAGRVVLEERLLADPGCTGSLLTRLGVRGATATGAGSDD